MAKNKILLIGATGMIGSKLVNSFIDNNYLVRILTRDKIKAQKKLNQDLDVFEGNILEPNSLIGLFNNIDGVYVYLNDFNENTLHKTFSEGISNIIDLAKFQKTNRIIFQSAATACNENNWFPLAAAQLGTEKLIANSGLNYTIVKPGYFMEALKFFLRGNQASIIGDGKYKYNWVAGDEFAQKACKIYSDKSYIGKSVYLHGPESLTLEEALRKYCEILKPNAKFNFLNHEMMWSISRFSNNKEMSFIADYIKFMDSTSDNFENANRKEDIILSYTINKWLEKQYATS